MQGSGSATPTRTPLRDVVADASWPNGGEVATALLRATAEGDGERAAELAAELARAVLDAPATVLARQILEGGPLAITRALRLADAVLATESVATSPKAGVAS